MVSNSFQGMVSSLPSLLSKWQDFFQQPARNEVSLVPSKVVDPFPDRSLHHTWLLLFPSTGAYSSQPTSTSVRFLAEPPPETVKHFLQSSA